MTLDLTPIFEAMRQAAALCEAVQHKHIVRSEKTGREPVTIADYGAQALICRALAAHFPGDGVIAEEAGEQFMPLVEPEQRAEVAAMIGAKKPGSVPRPAAALSAFVFEKVWKLFGIQKRPPVTRDALNLVGSDNRFPIDRAQRELGYAPRVSYEEGLKHIREYLDLHPEL